jgi:DNA-binding transcriptional MerR regulator
MSMTIGELADAAGVHVETVRYYERRGLLPEPPRTASGYRQYSDDDVWRLRFVARGKTLGFTLAEIHDLIEERDSSSAAVLAATRAKLRAVKAKQQELESVRSRLETLAQLCERGDAGCDTLAISD